MGCGARFATFRRAYAWYLDQVCARTGHFGACVVMGNTRGYGPAGRLWHRFVGWVLVDWGRPSTTWTVSTSSPNGTTAMDFVTWTAP